MAPVALLLPVPQYTNEASRPTLQMFVPETVVLTTEVFLVAASWQVKAETLLQHAPSSSATSRAKTVPLSVATFSGAASPGRSVQRPSASSQ